MYRPAYVKWVRKRLPTHPVSVLGLNFPNPVGLAAGLDKNGDCIDALFGLGFGFIEVGTVTPRPQPGNAKPRLFRLLEAEALINRYGFNNKGVMHLVQQLKKRKVPGIVGVNIGKNAITPLEQAFDDYRYCLEAVYPYADYVTVNVSSPNTPGLRDLQSSNYLDELLKKLKQEQNRLSEHYRRRVPLLLKISPDLSQEALQDIARLALHHQIDGLVATNTTLQRTGVEHCQHAKETGGLSGAPLFPLALNTVRQLYQYTQGQLPIIAVGGINSAERAHSLMEAGASLVQLYTGLIWDAGLAIGIASVSGSS